MKNALLAVLVIMACSLTAFASNCTSTTYDVYISQGSCGINDQVYSAFAYVGTSNPPGFSIPAGSVQVTPITTPGNPGLQFSAGWLASTGSGVLEQDSLFEFQVNSTSPITDLTLTIGGASFIGTGEVVVAETACLGAILPACTGGQLITLTVFDDAAGQQLTDTVNFTGVNEISVEKDLTVAAGTNGLATVSVLTDQFSEGQATVPEPGTLSLMGLGGLGLLGFARRKLNL